MDEEKDPTRLAERFRKAEEEYQGKDWKPWFLSERDALAWEKNHMDKKKPSPSYVCGMDDARDIRAEYREALNLITKGDEIAMSSSGNSVVVMAVGPMTLEVAEAIKKIFDKINGV